MADISPVQHRQKAGVAKARKLNLRVDLTPMVDLGFLLIAFFVFTTTIQQSTAMKLALPDDRTKSISLIGENRTINLLLGAGNTVFVYNGTQLSTNRNIGTSAAALRTALIEKKRAIQQRFGSDSDMVALIKPTPAATYSDVVHALDEMLICNIKTYMLVDANEAELKAIGQ